MNDSKKLLVKILILSIAVNGIDVMMQWITVSPWGKEGYLLIPMILTIPLIISLILIPASLTAAIFKRIRQKSLMWLYSSVIYFCIGLFLFKAGGFVRMHAFHELAERSTVLVEAIHHYDKDNGHPPKILTELVPRYIREIPKTGIGAYPEYDYELVTDPKKWDENPWVLYVNTPIGMLNWDMFLYFPKQNYPQHGYGGYLERIKDWAYVHE
jgi:hypothetical protein